MNSVHLGDGAYITRDEFGVVITANHHDPKIATDRVYIDAHDIPNLVEVLKQWGLVNC